MRMDISSPDLPRQNGVNHAPVVSVPATVIPPVSPLPRPHDPALILRVMGSVARGLAVAVFLSLFAYLAIYWWQDRQRHLAPDHATHSEEPR